MWGSPHISMHTTKIFSIAAQVAEMQNWFRKELKKI